MAKRSGYTTSTKEMLCNLMRLKELLLLTISEKFDFDKSSKKQEREDIRHSVRKFAYYRNSKYL